MNICENNSKRNLEHAIEEIVNSLSMEDFEKLVFLYIQLSEMYVITEVDINLGGQVKYIDCYDETTGKTMLMTLCLEDRAMERNLIETMNPGYDRYEVLSFGKKDKREMLEFLYEQYEDRLPKNILELKEKVDEIFENI